MPKHPGDMTYHEHLQEAEDNLARSEAGGFLGAHSDAYSNRSIAHALLALLKKDRFDTPAPR